MAVSEEGKPGDRAYIGPASGEVILARAREHLVNMIVLGIPVACISLGLLTLMAVPLAHVIAGKHTDFTLTVSVSISAVLAVTTTISGAGFAIQSRNARHHKSRARELEKKIKNRNEDQEQGKTSQRG
jgi:hypothetical protein